MKLFSRRTGSADEGVGDAGSAQAPSPDERELAIEGYGGLDGKDLTDRFRQLTQVQLGQVEDYERSHRDRPEVLAKLRYLRTSEPIAGYDELEIEKISEALVGADSETVKAVRDYERRFRRRTLVLKETARVLPGSEPSAGETKAQDEKDARVRARMRPS